MRSLYLLMFCVFFIHLVNAEVFNGFEYTETEEGIVITACSVATGNIELPETIEGKSVVAIGVGAFASEAALTGVEIPGTVRVIDGLAFSGCSSLETVELSEGVVSIGTEAFWSCSSLSSIVLPKSLDEISKGAFAECTSLANVSISNGLMSLGESAFENCDALTSIYLPASLSGIGNYTFSDSDSLSQVTINFGLEFIGDSAFESCDSLETITIASSVEELGAYVFANCDNLSSIVFSGNAPSLGSNAFEGSSAELYYYFDRTGFDGSDWSNFELVELGSYIWRDAIINTKGNVLTSDWYGWFYINDYPLIYHPKHGYQYCYEDTSNSLYLWDYATEKWFWTSKDSYPWIYIFTESPHYYYFSTDGTAGNRWFSDTHTGAWVFETNI